MPTLTLLVVMTSLFLDMMSSTSDPRKRERVCSLMREFMVNEENSPVVDNVEDAQQLSPRPGETGCQRDLDAETKGSTYNEKTLPGRKERDPAWGLERCYDGCLPGCRRCTSQPPH